MHSHIMHWCNLIRSVLIGMFDKSSMLPRIDHELVRQNDDARGAVSLTDIFEIETAITGLALYLTSNVYFSFVFFHDIMAQMEDPEATMEAALASRYTASPTLSSSITNAPFL